VGCENSDGGLGGKEVGKKMRGCCILCWVDFML
jgi:hypothetical protein